MRPLRYYAPGSLSQGSNLRRFFLLVLPVVESFPGAQSPLGSKEPIELFLSPRKVFVASTPPRPAHTVYGPPHDGNPRTEMTRMFFRYGSKELQQLTILADRRPRSLNEFAAQSGISAVSNRAASGSRLHRSLMIGKSDRDTFLVHIESGKHVVITSDERLASHRSASLVQRLIDFSHCTLMEHSRYSSTSLIQVSGRTDKYSISYETTPFVVSLVEP